MENLKGNIQVGRKLKKLTQGELANMLNVSRGSIVNWENGLVEPPISALVKMSKVFCISIPDMLFKDLNVEDYNGKIQQTVPDDPFEKYNVLIKAENFAHYAKGKKVIEMERVIVPGVKGKARTFEVFNDAMAPVLMFGDYVVCLPVPSEKQRELSPGRIFVVVTEKSEIIMQYCQSYKEGLKVFPHNLAGYTWQVIPYSQIFEVWEVYLRISKHFLLPYVISEIAPQLANEPKARV